MILLDTSVLVASSYREHPRHMESRERVVSSIEQGACCAAHTLAETFSSLTRLPLPQRITPLEAFQIVQRISTLCKVITLTPNEYLQTIKSVAQRGITGGVVYDALLLTCARKANATAIYTLNLKHFRLVAPDLAPRILEP